MGVWSFKTCGFCQGTGVNVPRAKYEQWQRLFKSLITKAVQRGDSRLVYDRTRNRLEKILKSRPPCSFCNGTGAYNKKEADEEI